MLRLTVGMTLLLVVACAHDVPMKPDATVKPDATAGNGAAASARSQPAVPATASAVNKDLVKRGYHTATYGGELLYCRMEQVTGTNFKKERCASESRLLDEERRTKESLNAPRQAPKCVGIVCS